MSSEQERLRFLLKARLNAILAEVLPEQMARAKRVRVVGGQYAAVLHFGPAAEVLRVAAEASGQCGQWLSPLESAIMLAIGADTLQGKEVAAKTGQPYDHRLKALLRNLVDRDILTHRAAEGYRRAVQSEGTPASLT